MARIAGAAKQDKIIGADEGANYYRLVGLEIADTEANGAQTGFYNLILLTATTISSSIAAGFTALRLGKMSKALSLLTAPISL